MGRYALPYPVLMGKSDIDVLAIPRLFYARPRDYWESRWRAGITLERVYYMKTPIGNFMIAYSESDKALAGTLAGVTDPVLDINRRFVAIVKELNGVDLRQKPMEPLPETIGEWVESAVGERGSGLAFLAPLVEGQLERIRGFAQEAFVARKAEHEVSRRALKMNVEVMTLFSASAGSVVCIYLEGEDPVEANRLFAASQTPYDRWFKDECKKIFVPMMDFDVPLPAIEMLFDSTKVPMPGAV